MDDNKKIISELKQNKQIAIFGAGVMALGVVNCFLNYPYQLSIECCLVSDKEKNPAQISGIPVFDFTEAEKILDKNALVVIAAVDKNLESMREILYQHGYIHILPLSYEGDLWSLIRENFYREYRLSQGKPYLRLKDELKDFSTSDILDFPAEFSFKRIKLYTARCHVDRELKEDISRYSWEVPIQVGADLTEQRICLICDNTGDNISKKIANIVN